MPANQEMEDFARLIEALHPWLDQVVVIGGWAHRLYRLHPLAQRLDYDRFTILLTNPYGLHPESSQPRPPPPVITPIPTPGSLHA